MGSLSTVNILDLSKKTEGNSEIRRWVERFNSRRKSVGTTRGNASRVIGNFWKVITFPSQQSITVVTTTLAYRQKLIKFESRRILVTAVVQGQHLMNQLRRISSSKVDQVRIEKDFSDSTWSIFNESIAKNFMQEIDVLCKVIVLVCFWCGKLNGAKFRW